MIKRFLVSTFIFTLLSALVLMFSSWVLSTKDIPWQFWLYVQLIVIIIAATVNIIGKLADFADDIVETIFDK